MLTGKRMALLKEIRLGMCVRQADVAQRIQRADGSGLMTDAELSRIEAGIFPLADGFAWTYLEAVAEAKRES